jgi:hypothetical protein
MNGVNLSLPEGGIMLLPFFIIKCQLIGLDGRFYNLFSTKYYACMKTHDASLTVHFAFTATRDSLTPSHRAFERNTMIALQNRRLLGQNTMLAEQSTMLVWQTIYFRVKTRCF